MAIPSLFSAYSTQLEVLKISVTHGNHPVMVELFPFFIGYDFLTCFFHGCYRR